MSGDDRVPSNELTRIDLLDSGDELEEEEG